MPSATLEPGENVDVVDGCPNENFGTEGADDVGSVAVDEDEDAPENEKMGGVGCELSDVVAEVETGGAGVSTLAAAGVEPKVMGEGGDLEGPTTTGDGVDEEISGFAKENGAGLEALSVEGGWGWVVAPSVEGERADVAPVTFPKTFGTVDDGAVVEVGDDTCGGFANGNGERELAEKVVVGAAGALGKSVDVVTAGIRVEGNEKPGVVVEAAAEVPLIELLVLGRVAKEKVEMFDLLCGAPSSEPFPSIATAGAGVSVIIGTDDGLVPSSGAVTLVGISVDFWSGV